MGGREDREKKWEGLLGSLAPETNESIIVKKKTGGVLDKSKSCAATRPDTNSHLLSH